MELKEIIENAVTPALNQHNMELIDLVVGKYRQKTMIQFFIDKNEGKINLDECQKMSNILGGVLDMEEIIQGAYVLEVSSPGINRPLTKPKHFKQFVNSRVKVELKQPLDGQRNFVGIILDPDDESFTLDDGKIKHKFNYDIVNKAKLDIDVGF